MVEALLEHVRPAGSVGDTLVRIREHLASAIEYAREDGEMPTDEADLARIGRLVEDLTEIILSSAVTSEHFVFGAYGAFGAMLASPSTFVSLEFTPDDVINAAIEDKAAGTTAFVDEKPYGDGLDAIRQALAS